MRLLFVVRHFIYIPILLLVRFEEVNDFEKVNKMFDPQAHCLRIISS